MLNKPKLALKEIELGEDSGYQSDRTYQANAQKIALENLRMQHEALQHSLDLMWKTMLLSGSAVLVSAIAVVIALIK